MGQIFAIYVKLHTLRRFAEGYRELTSNRNEPFRSEPSHDYEDFVIIETFFDLGLYQLTKGISPVRNGHYSLSGRQVRGAANCYTLAKMKGKESKLNRYVLYLVASVEMCCARVGQL